MPAVTDAPSSRATSRFLDPPRTPMHFRWLWSSSVRGNTFANGVDGGFTREIERFKAEVSEVTQARLQAGA